MQGRHDDIFINELSAKRDNREPLDDFEKTILRKIARRNWRLLRAYYARGSSIAFDFLHQDI